MNRVPPCVRGCGVAVRGWTWPRAVSATRPHSALTQDSTHRSVPQFLPQNIPFSPILLTTLFCDWVAPSHHVLECDTRNISRLYIPSSRSKIMIGPNVCPWCPLSKVMVPPLGALVPKLPRGPESKNLCFLMLCVCF